MLIRLAPWFCKVGVTAALVAAGLLWMGSPAYATLIPMTFTDIVDPDPDILISKNPGAEDDDYSYTHSFDDYDSLIDTFTSITLSIKFEDNDGDTQTEKVYITYDGATVSKKIGEGGVVLHGHYGPRSWRRGLADSGPGPKSGRLFLSRFDPGRHGGPLRGRTWRRYPANRRTAHAYALRRNSPLTKSFLDEVGVV